MAIDWPGDLFRFQGQGWSITGASVDGGRSLAGGSADRAVFGGGGLWVCRLKNVLLLSREAVNTWAAIAARCNNGAETLIVPHIDPARGPVTSGPILVPHDDQTGFSDGALYLSGAVASTIVTAASFRSTRISFILLGGLPLIGGEPFSIRHPIAGWRIYIIASVESATPVEGGFVYDVTFRVPLRDDVPAGTEIEWQRPRCEMTLDDIDGMAMDLDLNRNAMPSVTFVEDFTAMKGMS